MLLSRLRLYDRGRGVALSPLRLDDGLWPIAFLPIGYPAQAPSPKPRRPLTEFVRDVP